MLVAICDDEKAECEKVSGILAQKMRKRREPLQIVCFQQGEDLIEQYEDGRKPGYDLIFMDIFFCKKKTGWRLSADCAVMTGMCRWFF